MNRHQQLQPRRIADLLDAAIWLYRDSFGAYLRALAFPFIVSLVFVYNTYDLLAWPGSLRRLLLYGWSAQRPLGLLLERDLFFPDGALFWTLTAAALAPMTAHAYLHRERAYRDGWSMPSSVWVAAGLAALPVLLLRWAGAGVLADLARLPTLFVAHVMILESAGIAEGFRRSWALARPRPGRCLLALALTVGLVRLATAAPVVAVAVLDRWIVAVPPLHGQLLAALALAAVGLVYAAAQNLLTLLYLDQRIRLEGLDLSLAARRQAGEAGETP